MLPLRIYLGPTLGKYVRPHHPYPELTAELVRRFPKANTIVADGTLVAGNLHFQNPSLRTLLLREVIKQNTHLEGDILLVMQAKTDAGWIEHFRSAFPEAEIRQHGRLTLNYRFGGKETISFDYAYVVIRS
jgi:hypothetical protein